MDVHDPSKAQRNTVLRSKYLIVLGLDDHSAKYLIRKACDSVELVDNGGFGIELHKHKEAVVLSVETSSPPIEVTMPSNF